MTEDLPTRIAKIKPGDHVTIQIAGEVKATATSRALILNGIVIRHPDGSPRSGITALIEHTPALPPEPEIGALRLDRIGDVWRRFEDGWRFLRHNDGSWSHIRWSWAGMQDLAPLTGPREVAGR